MGRTVEVRDRALSIILILILVLSAASCDNAGTSKSSSDVDHSTRYYSPYFEGFFMERGYYYQDFDSLLHFFDYGSKQSVVVCNKPHCKHERSDFTTPEHERCPAWINSLANGFVDEDKLYLILEDFDDKYGNSVIKIISSDLDRENQTEVASFEAHYSLTYAVHEHSLYGTATIIHQEPNDQGIVKPSGKTSTWLYRVDLEEHKVEELTEKRTGYSNVFDMIGVHDGRLYLRFTHSDKPYDHTKPEETEVFWKYYIYDLEEKSLSPILDEYEDHMIFTLDFADDYMVLDLSREDLNFDGINDDNNTIKEIIIKNDEIGTKTIGKTSESPKVTGGNIIFYNIEEKQWTVYDLSKDSKRTTFDFNKDIILHTAGDEYTSLIMKDVNSQEWNNALIKNNDLIKGKDNFIILP